MTAPAGSTHPPEPGADRVDSARGWLVVAGTVLATMMMFGVVYSFGAFFGAMAEDFDAGKGSTAFVFSLTIFFLFVLGALTGRLADRFGPRPLAVAAAVFIGGGLWATSTVDRMAVGYLTYGVSVGVGVACAYVPLITLVSGWFERQRATALGIASAGIGLGTVLGAPVARRLIDAYDWRDTYRILAVVAAAGLLVAAALSKRAPLAAGRGPSPTIGQLFAGRTFRLMYASGALMGLSLFVPFVFLIRYAEEQGIAPGTAATLVSVLGVGSMGGRLVLGAIGSRLDLQRLYLLCFLTMTVSFLIWLVAGSSFVVLVLFALVLGVSYGGYVALSPAVAAQLFGLQGLGGTVGMLYTGSGVGALAGPPAAGWLIDTTGSYRVAEIAALVIAFGSFLLLLAALRRPASAGASAPAAASSAVTRPR
ncbi:MAG: MFS transporter [Acidimicrobiales bacterium]